MRVALVLLIFLPLTVAAQETIHGFYANAKVGVGNWLNDNSGIGLSFEGGLLRNKTMYTASYLRSEEIENREVINCIDLTIGRFARSKGLIFHYQAGLGMLWGKQEHGDDEPFVAVGLPVKTGIKFVPPNFFSIGVDLQANLNTKRSLYLVMFTVGVWPHQNPH
jgi:hypothetical protein